MRNALIRSECEGFPGFSVCCFVGLRSSDAEAAFLCAMACMSISERGHTTLYRQGRNGICGVRSADVDNRLRSPPAYISYSCVHGGIGRCALRGGSGSLTTTTN
jgi:hypothetical protein